MSVIKFYPSLFFLLLSIFYKELQISLLTAANDVVITIPALGRTTKLGALYSGPQDRFSTLSIFQAELSEDVVRTTGIPFTKTNFQLVKTQSDKNVLLGICAGVNAAVNLGFFGVSGSASAEYLHDIKTKSQTIEAAMNMETASVRTNVDILSNELLALVDDGPLSLPGYSHAVIGISWGAQIVIQFEFFRTEKLTKGRWKTSWQYQINVLFFNTGNTGSKEGDLPFLNDTKTGFKYKIYGESSKSIDTEPKSVDEVFEIIRKFPKTIYADNDGKGQQMFFHLMPLARIRRVLQLKNPERFANSPKLRQFKEVPQSRGYLAVPEADKVVVQLEEAEYILSKLRNLNKAMQSNRFLFNRTDLERVEGLYQEYDEFVKKQKVNLKNTIVDLRIQSFETGTDIRNLRSASVLYDILNNFDRTMQDVEDEVDSGFEDEKLKIAMASFLISKGVGWVGRDSLVDNVILQFIAERDDDDTQFCQIHFYREYLQGSFGFVEALLDLIQSSENKFLPIIIDCDFVHDSCGDPSSHERICEPIYLQNVIDAETRRIQKREIHNKPCKNK